MFKKDKYFISISFLKLSLPSKDEMLLITKLFLRLVLRLGQTFLQDEISWNMSNMKDQGGGTYFVQGGGGCNRRDYFHKGRKMLKNRWYSMICPLVLKICLYLVSSPHFNISTFSSLNFYYQSFNIKTRLVSTNKVKIRYNHRVTIEETSPYKEKYWVS